MTFSTVSNFLKKYTYYLFFSLLVVACASPPEYPDTPAIEFLELTKDTLPRAFRGDIFTDSTFISLSFTDGDGDIGARDSSLNLVVIDSRNGFENDFRIPFVPEFGDSGLKGEISVRILTSCCIFPDSLYLIGCESEWPDMPYDVVTYDVYIKDRAGNFSNTITTSPLYIRCFE